MSSETSISVELQDDELERIERLEELDALEKAALRHLDEVTRISSAIASERHGMREESVEVLNEQRALLAEFAEKIAIAEELERKKKRRLEPNDVLALGALSSLFVGVAVWSHWSVALMVTGGFVSLVVVLAQAIGAVRNGNS